MPYKALVFHGGWEGHSPKEIAQRYVAALTEHGYDVTQCEGLDCLDDATQLASYDLIIPCVTMAELSHEREAALTNAVKNGTGLAAAHGSGDAFRGALNYCHMMGGQFVSHPYVGEYAVRVTQPEHPLTAGMPSTFAYDSEQYYLHVDPGNNVLLATDYQFDGNTINMPVAWTKNWGAGKVFYCALGHKPTEYDEHPHVWQFIVDGALWATRKPA
ncbi:ThuA domain-containing protein [Cerasicoccus fimbriatus]|uniref:ThuA domain-containing protein n=1 Tax=Cerasicoccus fimbriatus TaxID=3014554 RepID=UPI0022B4CDDE|nr:ThuA domain-containing protein [Cerasicoccus sp. TK19100]